MGTPARRIPRGNGMTAPDPRPGHPAASDDDAPADHRGARKAVGSSGMLMWQVLLGIAILLIWQGASGRLVDNFFISNPLDVFRRLAGWIADGSIFGHLW